MKKTFTALLLLLCTLAVHAQGTGPTTQQQDHNLFSGFDRPNSGLGIKAGVNFAEINGSDKGILGDISGHTNFHAGVFAQFALGNFFSIQPEVLYSRKGYERNDSTFRFDYLEVPLLAVFNFTENISIHLGPQLAMMVSAKEEDEEVNLDRYNTTDYGMAAGFEARVRRLRLGGRYSLSFADLIKTDAAGRAVNYDIKPGAVQVYIGIGL